MDHWLFCDYTGPLSHGGDPECALFWLEGPASWSTGQVSSVFNFVVCGFMLIYHLYTRQFFSAWSSMHNSLPYCFTFQICFINKSSLCSQKAELRCLLPRSLLEHGFFSECTAKNKGNDKCEGRVCNYSWSGQRKTPSYLNKLVFPEKFLTALRTIALQEDELFQVQSMLEEVQFL